MFFFCRFACDECFFKIIVVVVVVVVFFADFANLRATNSLIFITRLSITPDALVVSPSPLSGVNELGTYVGAVMLVRSALVCGSASACAYACRPSTLRRLGGERHGVAVVLRKTKTKLIPAKLTPTKKVFACVCA